MNARSVAVTGASGRLGSALAGALSHRTVHRWSRPEYDLDTPDAAGALLDRDIPSVVFHCAAWTDVDGCARDPRTAHRRNASAVDELARACARRGVGLVLISTNEVFDGSRTDGRGYLEEDEPNPVNPYGSSKLAGEGLAGQAFTDHDGPGAPLWIVRTAWLYGPPGNDFPGKILAAADRLDPGQPLGVVHEEVGSPTYTIDLARGIRDLVECTDGGLYHLVNEGHVSRHEWATKVLLTCRPGRSAKRVSMHEFRRPSQVPLRAVLDTALARRAGVQLRPWEAALTDYLSAGC